MNMKIGYKVCVNIYIWWLLVLMLYVKELGLFFKLNIICIEF